MKSAFETASRNAKTHALYEAGVSFINALLFHAQAAHTIARFYEKQGREHPVLPCATFYVIGVDDEWRYAHAKRGGPREKKEKARVDYYMHAEIKPDQTMTVSFTTSQHAHAAKKMGWKKGEQELNVSDKDGLQSEKAKNFVRTIAEFLALHAETLMEQGDRRRRTIEIHKNMDPSP